MKVVYEVKIEYTEYEKKREDALGKFEILSDKDRREFINLAYFYSKILPLKYSVRDCLYKALGGNLPEKL